MFLIHRLAIIFLIFMPIYALALPEDAIQMINIIASSSLFDYKTGMDTYEGDVRIDQGTTHLTADRLVTKKNQQHKIEEAIATGIQRPAEYVTVPKANDPELRAKANIIKFYPLKSTIILEGDVVVTQGENSFHGPIIIYNIKDQTVAAPESKAGRSTIVLRSK